MGCSGSKEDTSTGGGDKLTRKVSERVATDAIAGAVSEVSRLSQSQLSQTSNDANGIQRGQGRRMSRHRKLSTSLMNMDLTKPGTRLSAAAISEQAEEDNEDDFVYLEEEDEERVDKVHATPAGARFARTELQQMLAAFKENDMVLPRGYFHIVYSTYARLDSPAVVDRVFEMFDKDRSGNFSFEEFVEFLGTVVKGGVEEKVEYFFRLYDKDGDGNLTKTELVDMLAQMPSGIIARSLALDQVTHMPSLAEEDDETEEAEAAAELVRQQQEELKDKEEEDAAILASLKDPTNADKRRSTDVRAQEASDNRERAIEVVDNCFVEMDVDGDSISLLDFKAHASNSETLQRFFPF
eukprot:m.182858 g.182858  ORF g.182858 m.182858 type:complete len:353 (+) comp16890_c0_seq1:119-1177(+)